jgi:hypothetical protein
MFSRAGIALLLGLSACKSEAPPVPHEKMEAIIADAHLAEVYATQVNPLKGQLTGDRNYDTLAVWYKSLFSHHGLTQQEYMDAMDWYEKHPTDLDTVYRHVVARLEKLAADTAKK